MGEVQRWVTLQDGLKNLKLAWAPMPTPGQDEVLVEIHAVSLNYRDTEVCMGLYNHHSTLGTSDEAEPIVPCCDMSGIITAIGPSSSPKWEVGDRVLASFIQTHVTGQVKAHHMTSGLGLPLQGTLQTHRVFSSSGLVKAPEHVTHEEGAAMSVAAVTAWMSINGFRPLGQPGGKGETVVLQGTGGVSIAGLQIAAASGATTIVTSSSDDKLEEARKLGATHLINYRTTPDWSAEVLKLTKDEGADIIFENGGASTLRQSFDCVSFGGLINAIGYLGGKQDISEDRTNINVLALKRNVTLKGILVGPRDRFEEMCAFYSQHKIRPVVGKVFKFDEAKEALEYLYAGKHFGKVVVKVRD